MTIKTHDVTLADVSKLRTVETSAGGTRRYYRMTATGFIFWKPTIARFLWEDASIGFSYSQAQAAAASNRNIETSACAIRIAVAPIEPRPLAVGDAILTDPEGGPLMQKLAYLILLPGETVEEALRCTYRGAVLLRE